MPSVVDIKLFIQSSCTDKRVCHANPLWFHGVVFGVDYLAESRVVEVGDFPICGIRLNMHDKYGCTNIIQSKTIINK